MNFINWRNNRGLFRLGRKYVDFNIEYRIDKDDVVVWLKNNKGLEQICTSLKQAKDFAEDDMRRRLIEYYKNELIKYKEIINISYDQIYKLVSLIPVKRWVRFGDINKEESAVIEYKIGEVKLITTVKQLDDKHWLMYIMDKDNNKLFQQYYLSFRAAKRSGIKYTRSLMVDEIGRCITEMIDIANIINNTDKGWK